MRNKIINPSDVAISRRNLLKSMTLYAAAPLALGFLAPIPVLAAHQFDPEETATMTAVIETIIPTDDTPGARETGTAMFVMMSIMSKGEATVSATKQALAGINALSLTYYGNALYLLSAAQKEDVTSHVASDVNYSQFWDGIRSLTVFHFYAHPQGYTPLGLPGPNIDDGGYPYAAGETDSCIPL